MHLGSVDNRLCENISSAIVAIIIHNLLLAPDEDEGLSETNYVKAKFFTYKDEWKIMTSS